MHNQCILLFIDNDFELSFTQKDTTKNMSDETKRRYVGVNETNAWDQPPAATEGDQTLAIARIALENLRGTDNWAMLCPFILALTTFVSLTWLWNTDELVTERKGYIFITLAACMYACVVLSKRVRDEQYADLLEKYGHRTRFYHESTVNQLRGTDAFRSATRFGLAAFLLALFIGIFLMPFSGTSKAMLANMCLQVIASTFVYANQKRNADTASIFLQSLPQTR